MRLEVLYGDFKSFPLSSGFLSNLNHDALSLHNPLKTNQACFVLSNHHDEILFICNRHVCAHALLPNKRVSVLPISETLRKQMAQV